MRLLYHIIASVWLAGIAAQPLKAQTQQKQPIGHAQIARDALLADPARALQEAQLALKSAGGISIPGDRITAEAYASWLESAALLGMHRASEALPVAEATLKGPISSLTPDAKLVGDLHMTVGGALLETGKIELALREFQAAQAVFDRAGERRSQAIALQMIGSTYLIARDFTHGVDFYTKSAELFGDDPALRFSAHFNIGNALIDQGKPAQAVVELTDALEMARKMKSPMIEARTIGLLATAQLMVGDVAGARQSVNQGLALASSGKSGDWVVGIYRAAAQIALQEHQLGRASERIEQAFAAVKGGASTLLLRDVERVAYEIYKARGEDAVALNHFEQYKKLDDQARANAASASAALLAAQFDFANQRASIAQLKASEVQNEAKIARSQRTILVTLLAGTALVAIIAGIGFLSIRRSRNQVRAANDELSGANAELEQALTARTQFLATTSHEIRTPLNGILGMTQVLLADRGLAADVKGKIELVHGAGETMRALVDDILDVAKMTTGELKLHPAEMDLHRLLKDTVQVWSGQAQSKGISIVVDVADCPQRIVQDEVRLRQIIFNLTANAVKFTDRGEVSVVARAIAHGNGELLRVQISDTGIGIPPDKLEEIFESFRQVDSGTTRRHGGTGLGLAICRNLAQTMGGDITVASVLGAGATFTLDIPLERAADSRIASAADGPLTLDKARLLLVEANPLSQSILRAVLSPKVASFATASGAEEAAAVLAEGQTDLVVMDATTMKMDFVAIQALAETVGHHGGRTVLMWPTPDEKVGERVGEIGVSRLLATPLAAPELVAALIALYAPVESPEEVAA